MKGDPWGGSEEFWFRIAVWMSKKGYRVHCAFYGWPGEKQEKINVLTTAGCDVTILTNPKCSKNIFDKLKKKFKVQREVEQLLNGQYDLVCISQGGFEEILHPPFRQIFPLLKNFVLINHNYNENRLLSLRRKQRLRQWTHAARLNIAAADKVFKALKNIAGFEIPNQLVLVNPVTVAIKNDPVAWPPLNTNGNFCWVVLAQLDVKRKAQDVLIKALSSAKWQQRNWELLLYGKGEDKELLEQLSGSSVVKDKIHLMGHTNAVEKVLTNAHLLLQITHIDAMPLSVTEAMNMARPCIVSKTGDMPLWIKDGSNGFIAGEVTEAGIDAVMEKAWIQKENWQQMGLTAFDIFQQKYPRPYEAYYENIFSDLMD